MAATRHGRNNLRYRSTPSCRNRPRFVFSPGRRSGPRLGHGISARRRPGERLHGEARQSTGVLFPVARAFQELRDRHRRHAHLAPAQARERRDSRSGPAGARFSFQRDEKRRLAR